MFTIYMNGRLEYSEKESFAISKASNLHITQDPGIFSLDKISLNNMRCIRHIRGGTSSDGCNMIMQKNIKLTN